MLEISSSSNERYKSWQQLLTSKGIKKQGLALVSGAKIVKEVLLNMDIEKQALLLPNSMPQEQVSINSSHLETYILSPDLFRTLDINNTKNPLLIVKTPTQVAANFDELKETKSLVIATSDPSNTGAIIRTATALGIENIVLTTEACHPYHSKAIKTSSGACFQANLYSAPSIKDLDQDFIYLDLKGENIYNYQWPKSGLLLVGEEGQGIPSNIKSTPLNIPISNKVESLSAPISSAIALSQWQQHSPK